MRAIIVRSFAGAFLVLAAAFPAGAADEAPYVGVWSLELRHCGTPQSSPEAPMAITKDGYDQHETHCTFKSVEASGADFKVAADCSVEGDTQTVDLMLTVSGDTLTVTDEAGARDFLRCK